MLSDAQVQDIGSMVNLMKKYVYKQRKGVDDTSKTSMASPSYSGYAYTPLIKQILAKGTDKAIAAERGDKRQAILGNNMCSKWVDYCADVQKATNTQVFNLTTPIGNSNIDNTVTALLKYTINNYTKEANITRTAVKEAGLTAHEAKDITDDQLDKYINKVGKMSPDSLDQTIADRVAEATRDFVEKRNDTNEDIKAMYNKAMVDKSKTDNPQDQANIEAAVKRFKGKMENRPVPLMEAIVTLLTEYAINHEDVKAIYTESNGDLNMEPIVEDAQAIYTVIEASNTYGLINVTPSLVEGFLKSFK